MMSCIPTVAGMSVTEGTLSTCLHLAAVRPRGMWTASRGRTEMTASPASTGAQPGEPNRSYPGRKEHVAKLSATAIRLGGGIVATGDPDDLRSLAREHANVKVQSLSE